MTTPSSASMRPFPSACSLRSPDGFAPPPSVRRRRHALWRPPGDGRPGGTGPVAGTVRNPWIRRGPRLRRSGRNGPGSTAGSPSRERFIRRRRDRARRTPGAWASSRPRRPWPGGATARLSSSRAVRREHPAGWARVGRGPKTGGIKAIRLVTSEYARTARRAAPTVPRPGRPAVGPPEAREWVAPRGSSPAAWRWWGCS